MASQTLETTCCVVGGGPAGMMLGYLLARAGVTVTVLEKHQDFNRDFRGDTVHPSTLGIMDELGILDDFLKVPHQKITSAGGLYGDYAFTAANFASLRTRCNFVALMPQWDFLDFLAAKAKQLPGFTLRMQYEATDLIREGNRIQGVVAKAPKATAEIHCDLVVGCDGRHSLTRQAAGFAVQEFGVPIDVLWFRIDATSPTPEHLLGNLNYGKALVLIPRGDYYQAGLIIRKGSFEQVREEGLDEFRRQLRLMAPFLGDPLEELRDWAQVKLLSVQINRLRQWHRPGLLCIGDAAHAMSPAGGVGINLAIQDAVAAANILARPLRQGRVTEQLLAAVQRRRQLPTRAIQFLQVNMHKGLTTVFRNPGPATAPWQLKVMANIPGVQQGMARVLGLGIRPEHVDGARAQPACKLPGIKNIAVAAGLALAGAVIAGRLLRAFRKPMYGWR